MICNILLEIKLNEPPLETILVAAILEVSSSNTPCILTSLVFLNNNSSFAVIYMNMLANRKNTSLPNAESERIFQVTS
jgi:hypothetical protein